MADFAGVDFTRAPIRPAPFNITPELTEVTSPPASGVTRGVSSLCGKNSATFIVTPVTRASGGCYREVAGGQIYERILVNPRAAKLGFIISDTQFAVEAWNTFRNIGKYLTDISLLGTGNLTVANPYAMPTFYGAEHSRIYQVTVPRAGTPRLETDIVFSWLTGETGADCLVTGSRIVLFSPPIDWAEGVKERIEYLTDVLVAYSDAEQRRATRQLARRSLSYRAKGLNPRDAAGIESEIFGWQMQPYGVPWWPDATPLTADAAAGATVLNIDTTMRQFADGGIAAVWTGEFSFEALNVLTVASGSITLSSPLQSAWTKGALVMPVFLCRLPNEVSLEKLWCGGDQIDVQFIGEAQQVAPVPSPSVAPTQFLGFDVLEISPNWKDGLKRTFQRSLETLDPLTGPITVIDKGGSAVPTASFPWFLKDRTAINDFRAFVFARFGRFKPFWLPTWDSDLLLVQPVTALDTGIKVANMFYTRFYFPSASRRYIAMMPTDGGARVYRKVTNATDNLDGTETLTFDSAVGRTFAVNSTMISFLIFARLDSDQTEIDWDSSVLAHADLLMRELPRETP